MKKTFSTILGLVLIAGFIYLLWIIISTVLRIFINSLSNLNENQTTLLIAIIPSTISILGIVFTNYLEKSKEINFKNRQRKEEAYDNFLKVLYEFINQNRSGKTDEELLSLLLQSRKELILWGSDNTVKLYSEFMSLSQETPDDEPDKNNRVNSKLEKMILSIREDLGYKNSKLSLGDLLRFFR